MKYTRLFQYHARRLLLGADPEALFFIVAIAVLLLGLSISSMNILILASSFFLFIYGLALFLRWRATYG